MLSREKLWKLCGDVKKKGETIETVEQEWKNLAPPMENSTPEKQIEQEL